MVKDLDRPSSEMNIHHSNILRNSFILEEEENDNSEMTDHENEGGGLQHQKQEQQHHNKSHAQASNRPISSTHFAAPSMSPVQESVNEFEKKFELPFPELLYINLADNQVLQEMKPLFS